MRYPATNIALILICIAVLIAGGCSRDSQGPAEPAIPDLTKTDTARNSREGTLIDYVDVLLPARPLVVATNAGIGIVEHEGTFELINSFGKRVEVRDGRIFAFQYDDILEMDRDGAVLNTIDLPDTVTGWTNFCALPDGGFAIMDNVRDVVSFVDSTGAFIDEVAIPEDDGERLQNFSGIVVGDDLIVSETGIGKVFAIDLVTREASIFKDLSDLRGWIGGIAHRGGTFYITQAGKIHSFTEAGPTTLICDITDYNICEVVVVGRFLYFVSNFGGRVYRMNRFSYDMAVHVGGLNMPEDIEILP